MNDQYWIVSRKSGLKIYNSSFEQMGTPKKDQYDHVVSKRKINRILLDADSQTKKHYEDFLDKNKSFANNRTQYMSEDFKMGYLTALSLLDFTNEKTNKYFIIPESGYEYGINIQQVHEDGIERWITHLRLKTWWTDEIGYRLIDWYEKEK